MTLTDQERAACQAACNSHYGFHSDAAGIERACFAAGLAFARAEQSPLLARIERLERELEFAHRTAAEIVGVVS